MWGYPHIPVGRRVERPNQCRPAGGWSQVAAPTPQCGAPSWPHEYISGELSAFQLSSWELSSRPTFASQPWSEEKPTNTSYDEGRFTSEAPVAGGRSSRLRS